MAVFVYKAALKNPTIPGTTFLEAALELSQGTRLQNAMAMHAASSSGPEPNHHYMSHTS